MGRAAYPVFGSNIARKKSLVDFVLCESTEKVDDPCVASCGDKLAQLHGIDALLTNLTKLCVVLEAASDDDGAVTTEQVLSCFRRMSV